MLLKSAKGQASFELIALIAFVTVVALAVIFNYFVVSDSTTAVSILKTIAVKELNSASEYYFIRGIDFTVSPAGDSIQLTLVLQPAQPSLSALEQTIRNKAIPEIEKNTSYANATINFQYTD